MCDIQIPASMPNAVQVDTTWQLVKTIHKVEFKVLECMRCDVLCLFANNRRTTNRHENYDHNHPHLKPHALGDQTCHRS